MFVSGKPFQLSLMFVGEARSPRFTQVGYRFARGKHCSLLRKSVNNKSFIVQAPGVNATKLFSSFLYQCLLKGKLLQAILTFVGES
jgi:hypothetical protein